MGSRFFTFLWMLTWPVRLYLKRSPLDLGKARIFETFVLPVVPELPRSFLAEVEGGARVRLRYREALGLSVLAFGDFEGAEINALCEYACPGSTAIDVGANVGIVAVPLALAVGGEGRVIAFEPDAANAARLRENIRLNALTQVVVHEVALGEADGEIVLHLGSDPAFHSSVEVHARWRTDELSRVPCRTLDAVWQAEGRPQVSVVKIDVEGAELSVLKGARDLLASARPVVLLEAHDENRQEVVTFMRHMQYRQSRPRRFAPWNFLFLPEGCGPQSAA